MQQFIPALERLHLTVVGATVARHVSPKADTLVLEIAPLAPYTFTFVGRELHVSETYAYRLRARTGPADLHTAEGDMLDQLARAHLGSEANLAALIEANPHLLVDAPGIPAGHDVRLPAASPPVRRGAVRLWGRT